MTAHPIDRRGEPIIDPATGRPVRRLVPWNVGDWITWAAVTMGWLPTDTRRQRRGDLIAIYQTRAALAAERSKR